MSEDVENEESDGFERQELIESQLLHTEYEQAGEEYRYRDKLLHNSYYLLIVITAILAGSFLNYAGQDSIVKLGFITLLAGGLYTLLGLVILTHYVQRQSASALRTRLQGIADESIESIPRPFAVEYRVIGQDSEMNNEQELDDARPFFSRVLTLPDSLHSAEALAQVVLIVGFLLIVGGVGILTSGLPLIQNISLTVIASVVISIFVLGLRYVGSDLELRSDQNTSR